MIRVTIVFDNMQECSGLFETHDDANDFMIALLDCTESVNTFGIEEVQDD